MDKYATQFTFKLAMCKTCWHDFCSVCVNQEEVDWRIALFHHDRTQLSHCFQGFLDNEAEKGEVHFFPTFFKWCCIISEVRCTTSAINLISLASWQSAWWRWRAWLKMPAECFILTWIKHIFGQNTETDPSTAERKEEVTAKYFSKNRDVCQGFKLH